MTWMKGCVTVESVGIVMLISPVTMTMKVMTTYVVDVMVLVVPCVKSRVVQPAMADTATLGDRSSPTQTDLILVCKQQ